MRSSKGASARGSCVRPSEAPAAPAPPPPPPAPPLPPPEPPLPRLDCGLGWPSWVVSPGGGTQEGGQEGLQPGLGQEQHSGDGDSYCKPYEKSKTTMKGAGGMAREEGQMVSFCVGGKEAPWSTA